MKALGRGPLVFLLIAVVAVGAIPPPEQTGNRNGPLVENLLKLPSPLPFHQAPSNATDSVAQPLRPPPSPPDEGSPLEVLARYWAGRNEEREPAINDAIRERLLDACEAYPSLTPQLLSHVPDTPAAHDRIKALLDAERKAPQFGESWSRRVARHLMLRSSYLRAELIRNATAAIDAEGYVKNAEEVEALARLSWTDAQPVLEKLAASGQPRTQALALSLQYQHYSKAGDSAHAAELRTRLKAIVEDPDAPGRARDYASDALLFSEWQGRDDWYLARFEDPAFRELHDGYTLFSPICSPVFNDPDKWIPVMARMVADSNRSVHDGAVSCLIQFHLRNARRDALLPLLPWLDDPEWSSARDRLRLIQSMDILDMRESVPGLIRVLDQDDASQRSYAADSLAHFRDPRAVPALTRALEQEKQWHHRRRILKGLIACGGVTDEEVAHSIEMLARLMQTEEGMKQVSEYSYSTISKAPLSASVSLGLYLSEMAESPSETAVQTVIERAEQLRAAQPDLAERMLAIAHRWPARSADRDLLRRLADGNAEAGAIAAALERRESLRRELAEELRNLAAGRGFPAGVATVLLADLERGESILEGSDHEAISAILACARLTGDRLPVATVGHLLESTDPFVAQAAGAYLLAEDSEGARTIVLSKSPGQALILGSRMRWDPGHNTYGAFDTLEAELREAVLSDDGSDEVYALLSAGYWGSAGQILLFVRGESGRLVYQNDSSRYYERHFTREELAALREFLAKNKVEELGPFASLSYDGMQYEYVRVSRAGGRRVFMNNPGIGGTGGSPHDLLCTYFRTFLDGGRMNLHYAAAESVPGFEVLLADGNLAVISVWKSGDDLRLLSMGVGGNTLSNYAAVNEGGVEIVVAEPESNEPVWLSYSIKDGTFRKTERPPAFPALDSGKYAPPDFEPEDNQEPGSWALNLPEKTYRIGEWNEHSGFWEFAPGRDPVLLLEANCANPVVTPDGEWAVLAVTETDWSVPNYVVRTNVETREVIRLNVDVADTFYPIRYIQAHGKVLLLRARDEPAPGVEPQAGPEKSEFLLLDPATGKVEVVTGEFGPLLEQSIRPLQPTVTQHSFWAAIYDSSNQATQVGQYDSKLFVFAPALTLPNLQFKSSSMWVDAEEGNVYIAYRGHLLRVPLSSERNRNTLSGSTTPY